jgi:ethanolamine kinase
MQKWTLALPCNSPKQKARKELLQNELERSFTDLDNERGPGSGGFVFGHCDLLSANVIVLPDDPASASSRAESEKKVAFIDYEYATPCPAAFDIANHFAEWGGYDCDYNMLPTQSMRRQFLTDYLDSYQAHSDKALSDDMLDILVDQVDRYRGMPGLYWGIWALIQATISQIDFDYASYAEVRLGEYFAWRAEDSGSRAREEAEMPLRERRWAER